MSSRKNFVYLYFKDVFATAYLLRKGTRFLPNHVFATILYHSMSVEGIDDGQDKKKNCDVHNLPVYMSSFIYEWEEEQHFLWKPIWS